MNQNKTSHLKFFFLAFTLYFLHDYMTNPNIVEFLKLEEVIHREGITISNEVVTVVDMVSGGNKRRLNRVHGCGAFGT